MRTKHVQVVSARDKHLLNRPHCFFSSTSKRCVS